MEGLERWYGELASYRDIRRGLGEGLRENREAGEVAPRPQAMILGGKVDRSISWGHMVEVTADIVEGANKDHVRRKNSGF